MKTRIIQTRFWDDEFICSSDIYTQHLYIYLLTCQYLNICGIFQLSEAKIKFECKLTDNQFDQAKTNLENNKKIFFKNGWVYLVNARKNNNYENSPKNVKACEIELSRIPQEIKEYFDTSIYSTIDTSMDSTHKSKIKNNKSKIINQYNEIIKKIIDEYNLVTGKDIKSSKGFESNIDYWLEVYSEDDIKQAINNIPKDSYWKDKMDLTILFRRKNPQGENVDYIAKMLNYSQDRKEKEKNSLDEFLIYAQGEK